MAKNHRLKISKYRTIPELTLDLKPGVEGFVGDNAQGKTNILNALVDLVAGGNDPSKIRDGEESYTLTLEVLDGERPIATVSRIQTRSGSKLTGTGLGDKTPKQFLEELFDDYALSPMRLLQEDPVKYLKAHIPTTIEESDLPEGFETLDFHIETSNPFEYCEAIAKHIESIRLEAGRQKRQAEAVVKDLAQGLGLETPAPHDENAVRLEIAEVQKAAQERNAQQVAYTQYTRTIEGYEKSITDAEKRIAELEKELQGERALLADRRKYLDEKKASPPPQPASPEELDAREKVARGKLETVERWRADQSRRQTLREREKELEAAQERYDQLDTMFKHFAYELPPRLIERADLPLEGLGFRDGKLYVHDRRIDLMSETERSLAAVKLICAISKKKGLLAVCFDGLEVMDQEHRKEFLTVAQASGLKVLYTRVGKPEHAHEKEVVRSQA
jgi:hypothetical protein